MKTLHYTSEQCNALLDGRLHGPEEQSLRNHIETCKDCRLAFESLARIDAAVRRLPALKVRPDFTRSVMEKVLTVPKSSLAFRFLEKLSYVFGLLIVLGIMIAAFVVTGAFEKTALGHTKTVATGMAEKVGESIAVSISGLTAWLVQYLPFAFGKGSMGVAFFAVAVVMMLAAVDKLVGKRVVQK